MVDKFDYNKSALVAKSLIERFGANSSFIVKGNSGGYDEDGNVIAASADTSIIGTVTPLLQYKAMEIDGSTVKTGDCYVFFDSVADVPISAQITLNGELFRAVAIAGLTSAKGVKVYRKIQLRR